MSAITTAPAVPEPQTPAPPTPPARTAGDGPARAVARERILRLLVGGYLPPGARLSSTQISRQLALPRSAVREALITLEQDRLLRSSAANEFTVCQLSAAEAGEIYPLLGQLESVALLWSGPRCSLQTLDRISREFAQEPDGERRRELDVAFHAALVELAGNRALHAAAADVARRVQRYEAACGGRDHDEHHAFHAAILAALAAGDPQIAAVAVREHWDRALAALRLG